MTMDELFFFDGKPEELALYEALLDRLAVLGETLAVVHKTQISLKNRRVFACVSALRVLPKQLLPPHYLVLTLGLPYPLDSPRIAVNAPSALIRSSSVSYSASSSGFPSKKNSSSIVMVLRSLSVSPAAR